MEWFAERKLIAVSGVALCGVGLVAVLGCQRHRERRDLAAICAQNAMGLVAVSESFDGQVTFGAKGDALASYVTEQRRRYVATGTSDAVSAGVPVVEDSLPGFMSACESYFGRAHEMCGRLDGEAHASCAQASYDRWGQLFEAATMKASLHHARLDLSTITLPQLELALREAQAGMLTDELAKQSDAAVRQVVDQTQKSQRDFFHARPRAVGPSTSVTSPPFSSEHLSQPTP